MTSQRTGFVPPSPLTAPLPSTGRLDTPPSTSPNNLTTQSGTRQRPGLSTRSSTPQQPPTAGDGAPGAPARPLARPGVVNALAAASRATVNASAIVALGDVARGVGNTVLPPALRVAGQHVLSSLQRASANAAAVRGALQTALTALQSPAPGTSPADAQLQAHEALIRYAGSKASYADALLPVLHKASAVGVAGAGMAFGAGRSTGVALADTALRMHRGDEAALGIKTAPFRPGQNGADAVVNAAAQAALGSALGGVGSFVGQAVVAPLVNRINKQTAPVDVKAVVPDEMVALMNQVHPGAGDALRSKASHEQSSNQNIASDRNVAVGQFFFDAANATRAARQEPNQLGLAGNILTGTAVSACAGAAIGATIAINSALANIKVPDMAALRDLAGSPAAARGADALQALPHHDVPLFYTKRVDPPPFFCAQPGQERAKLIHNPVTDPVPQAEGRGVPAGNAAPAAPAPSAVASTINALTSMASRGVAMFKATVGNTVVAAMTPAFAASMPTESGATAARAAAAAIGIHTAIKPWFGELAAGIPAADKAIVARRQVAVNEAARQREAAAPVNPPPALQMVPLPGGSADIP
jgi:hypothetical protein